MITFLLSDSDLVNAIQGASRQANGLLVLNLPQDALKEQATKRVNLSFDNVSRTVQDGRLSVRFSPIQFALLRYISDNGRAGYETLQDAVWGGRASDSTIRKVISILNSKLLNSGFSIELVARHSRVSLEPVV